MPLSYSSTGEREREPSRERERKWRKREFDANDLPKMLSHERT